MLRKIKNSGGFTLLEVVMVMFVTGIVVLMAFKLITNVSVEKINDLEIENQRENYNQFIAINYEELKYANNVTVTNSENDMDVLKYENKKGEKISIIAKGEEFYQIVDDKKIEIGDVQKIEASERKIYKKGNTVHFNIQFKKIKAILDFGVVIRNE